MQQPASEPETLLVIAGRGFRVKWSVLRRMLLMAPPDWMRDSSIKAPTEKARGLRAGIKAFTFPLIGKMHKDLYGRDLKLKGGQDTLPVMWAMLADFLCWQTTQQRWEFVLDDSGQSIIDARPWRPEAATSALPGHVGTGGPDAQDATGGSGDRGAQGAGTPEAV